MDFNELLDRGQRLISGRAFRRVVSRGTLLVFGIALLFGGQKCLTTALDLYRDGQSRPRMVGRKPPDGSGLFGVIGLGLAVMGTAAVAFAFIPVSRMEKWFRPPTMHLHDESERLQPPRQWIDWL